MADSVVMSLPTISISRIESPASSTSDQAARKCLHKNLMAKLRPLPFQYIWAVHYDKFSSSSVKSANPSTYDARLTLLSSSVPTIADFYKIFNNIPWSCVPPRDLVHIFRSGVQPLWEDPENVHGGSWTLKVRRSSFQSSDQSDTATRVWEEICVLGCGGELQSALVEAGCKDAVLGMTFAPRGMYVNISIWLRAGDQTAVGSREGDGSGDLSWQVLQKTLLDRLSPELRPRSDRDYSWRKHSDHDGWTEAVGKDTTGITKAA